MTRHPLRSRAALVGAASVAALAAALHLLLSAAPVDAVTLAAFPLLGAVLVSLVPAATRGPSRVRMILDGAVLAAALFFVAWAVVLAQAWQQSDVTSAEHLLAVARPVADLSLAALALVALAGVAKQVRRPLALLAVVLAGLVAADTRLLVAELEGAGGVPGWVDLGRHVGFLALAWGAVRASRAARGGAATGDGPAADPAAAAEGPIRAEVRPRQALFAPSVAVLVAAGVGSVQQVREGALEPALFWTAVVTVVLVVVRQLVSHVELARLNRDLEVLVARRTEELAVSERRFRSLVEHSSDVIAILDPVTVEVGYVSDSVERVFGHTPDEVRGHRMQRSIHQDDRTKLLAVLEDVAAAPGAMSTVSYRLRHADGTWRDVETRVKNLRSDPSVHGLVLNSRDVTEQRHLEQQLSHQAFHDALTGLPNRALFSDRLEQALARASRTATPVGVLYLDLDGFKHVNDTFGHATGDQLLVAVAERLERLVRSADTVARFGGDEFAVLLADVPIPDHGERVARRLCEMFEVPFTVDGRELRVGASVGIADATTGLEDAGDVLRNADVAMYMAKSRGRGRSERFDPSMRVDVSERLALESELRQALDRNELFVEYQPVVDMAAGSVEGVEALVRWRHPQRGVVGPADFVPIAEESGLIGPIGTWVLLEACRQVRHWQREGHEGLSVNVNLSPQQVWQPELVDQVAGVLVETGLDPTCLTLEITESVLIDDVEEVVERLERLKSLGVTLAIDDFGTGYSSLSYLRKFPIDILKVDRSFVQGLGQGPEESALARAIIKLGRTFRLTTVAEGIEEVEQAVALREMGCDSGQGYYFHAPVEASEMAGLIDARWDLSSGRRVGRGTGEAVAEEPLPAIR